MNVEAITVELRGAKLSECHIGAVEWRLQIDESEAALYAAGAIDDELNITHVHADERKSCAELQVGRSTPYASDIYSLKCRQFGWCWTKHKSKIALGDHRPHHVCVTMRV